MLFHVCHLSLKTIRYLDKAGLKNRKSDLVTSLLLDMRPGHQVSNIKSLVEAVRYGPRWRTRIFLGVAPVVIKPGLDQNIYQPSWAVRFRFTTSETKLATRITKARVCIGVNLFYSGSTANRLPFNPMKRFRSFLVIGVA